MCPSSMSPHVYTARVCGVQLRRMQEMLAKMQADMHKQQAPAPTGPPPPVPNGQPPSITPSVNNNTKTGGFAGQTPPSCVPLSSLIAMN